MPALGHKAYAAVAQETTWGTKVVSGMSFLEFLSETLQATVSEKIVQGINASRVRTKRVIGAKTVAGDVSWEVNVEDAIGEVLKHTLPSEAFTGDFGGVGVGGKHVFTPAETLPVGLTWQIGRDDEVRDYFGGRVVQVGFEAALDELLQATAGLSFEDEEVGTPQAPTYTTENPLVYHTGTMEVDGSDIAVQSFSLTVATGLKVERRRLGSNLILEQQPGGYAVTGQIVTYVNAQTRALVTKFLAGTAASIELVLDGSALGTEVRRLGILVPVVMFNGETPKVPSADAEVLLTLPFVAIKDGSGTPDELIQLTLQNSRNSAY